MKASGAPRRVTVARHGTVVVYEAPAAGLVPRRVLEVDRGGDVLTALRWTADGDLARAWVKLADDSWTMIEPRATGEAPWGLSDRLWHATHPSDPSPRPLTVFEALAWDRIDRIPVLAEPARLPPGAGTAVLNLIAALAADAGSSRLAYRGPYPTEQLFLTLLESFRHHGDAADPLGAFLEGRLTWSPEPHERVRLGTRRMIHLRGRIERVVWDDRVYHRADRQGVACHAARRVRDVEGAVVCSLWALGEVIEDHLRLDPDATTVETIAPRPVDTAPARLPAAVVAGVASAAAALGAPPLAAFVREIGDGCELGWAALDRDLVAVDGARLDVSYALREAIARRLGGASGPAERLAIGVAAVTELAHLVGDELRARAQARVAALPPDVQERLLETEPPGGGDADARRIMGAVETLIADVCPG